MIFSGTFQAGKGTAPKPPSRAFFWFTALAVLALDWVTKYAVVHTMQPLQSIPLLGHYLQLTYVRNPGGAFSLLAQSQAFWRPVLLIGVAAVTMVVLMVLAHREKNAGLSFLLPIGLICGGAAGNLWDRITVGTVVDFIEVGVQAYRFPVFNAADSAVTVGVGWLLLMNFRNAPKPTEEAKTHVS